MQYGITRRKEKTMRNDLLECLVYLAMLLVGFAGGVITTSFYFHNASKELSFFEVIQGRSDDEFFVILSFAE